MINENETKEQETRKDACAKNDNIRIRDDGVRLRNIEVESERRNCHCHRRRMIVLARKAGIVDTKGAAQRPERERTITSLYLCDLTPVSASARERIKRRKATFATWVDRRELLKFLINTLITWSLIIHRIGFSVFRAVE